MQIEKSGIFGIGFFMKNKSFNKYIPSPVGWLLIETSETALLKISFVDTCIEDSPEEPDIITRTESQLTEYFQGKRKEFDLKIDPAGTPFQKEVWKWVVQVRFGETASYQDIAMQLGSNKKTRAVGMANGKNPIPIVVPCHRIIGTNGKLTGYAGGLERKKWLLQHEVRFSDRSGLLF